MNTENQDNKPTESSSSPNTTGDKTTNTTPSAAGETPSEPAKVPMPQVGKSAAPAAPAAPATEKKADTNAEKSAAATDPLNNPEGTTNEQLREQALEATKNVFDPEIPVNIYELGLIYDVIIDEERNAKVIMTLTSPACPAAQELPMEVQGRVAVILGINDVEVDVVFDPPWSPDKMSEAAKVQLGFDL